MLVPPLALVVELLNSAITAVADRISLNLHPLSKQTKDMGSADDHPDLGDHPALISAR